MKIEFVQRNTEVDVESYGTVLSKKEFMHMVEEWVDNHGTGVDDFDELHARFVDDEGGSGA